MTSAANVRPAASSRASAASPITLVSYFHDAMTRTLIVVLSPIAFLLLLPLSQAVGQVFTAWEARFNSGFNANEGKALAVDPAGNIYVTGFGYGGAANSRHYVTIKYDALGNQMWMDKYVGPGNSHAVAIAVDRNGDIYVTGESINESDDFDFLTIKYDAGGNRLWLNRYDSRPGWHDRAHAMAVDSSGNVFVTGVTDSTRSPNPDYLTIKYTPSGSLAWAERYNGEGSSQDNPRAIAVDGNGITYVTGTVLAPSTSIDCATVSYDPGGARRWVQRYGGSGLQFSGQIASAIALDAAGNVYVGGRDDARGLLIKYSSDGVQQWLRQDDAPWVGDVVLAVAATTVFMAGPVNGGPVAGQDYLTVKYDSSGNRHWLSQYNSADNRGDVPRAIAVDGKMNVYVTGTNGDYLTVKFDSTGAQKWAQQYSGPGGYPEGGAGIAVDGRGNVYVTGTSAAPIGYECATVAYAQGMRVTDPRPGERWIAEEQDTIRWVGRTPGTIVAVDYSLDSGLTYAGISSAVLGDSLIWSIPPFNMLTTRAKVRVRTVSGVLDTAVSDTFKIKGYTLTRMNAIGHYEAFAPGIHGWSYLNGTLWPQAWWNQFDYTTADDPNTFKPYPSRFHPMPDSSFIDWPLFVEISSVDECYWSTDWAVYKGDAEDLWRSTSLPHAGSCYGFSLSSLLAFASPERFFQLHPEIPNVPNIFTLGLTTPIRKVINGYYAYQFWKEAADSIAHKSSLDPRTTLQELREMLKGDTSEGRTLILINPSPPPTGGHAVTPYSITPDPSGPSRYRVWVYDSNNPGLFTPNILIDSLANTWTDFIGFGWGGSTKLFLDISPSRHLASEEPDRVVAAKVASSGRISVFNTPWARVVHTASDGKRVGYVDGATIEEIPGAAPMIALNGKPSDPFGFILPEADYATVLGGSSTPVYLTVLGSASTYTYERQNADSSLQDRLRFGTSFSVASSDSVMKTVALTVRARLDSSERIFVIRDTQLRSGDSLYTRETGQSNLILKSYGSTRTYELEINERSARGEGVFVHPLVTLQGNSSHTIVPDWSDVSGSPVRILVDSDNNGSIDDTLTVNNTVDVEDRGALEGPQEFSLAQNYPNPFNPVTTIRYGLAARSHVRLTVFNMLGQQVAEYVEGEREAGYHEVQFDGSGLASGVYVYRMHVRPSGDASAPSTGGAGAFVRTRTMLLLR